MISKDTIKDTVYELYKQAVIVLGDDVKKSLEDALKIEEHDLARLNIEAILKNIEIAEEKGIPMCQDTGLPVVFVKLGNVEVENLRDGIEEGIIKATKEIPIRPNIVDPLTRENTKINIGEYIPPIDIELIDEDYLEITILPKGFGSENNNALKMALPAEGIEGIKEFVVESVLKAKGKPCPPTVVGVGIGGTSDLCLKLGKKALLGKVGERNPDPQIAKLEEDDVFSFIDSGTEIVNYIWVGTKAGIGSLDCHYEIIFHNIGDDYQSIPSVEVHFEGKYFRLFQIISDYFRT